MNKVRNVIVGAGETRPKKDGPGDLVKGRGLDEALRPGPYIQKRLNNDPIPTQTKFAKHDT